MKQNMCVCCQFLTYTLLKHRTSTFTFVGLLAACSRTVSITLSNPLHKMTMGRLTPSIITLTAAVRGWSCCAAGPAPRPVCTKLPMLRQKRSSWFRNSPRVGEWPHGFRPPERNERLHSCRNKASVGPPAVWALAEPAQSQKLCVSFSAILELGKWGWALIFSVSLSYE